MLSSSKCNMDYTLNCNGKPLSLAEPKIMGIINLTPDSFYSESRASDIDALLNKVEFMISQGMDILDLGAVSSRPNAQHVTEKEELDRLMKPLAAIRKKFPNLLVSLDTYRTEVLKEAIEYDINMINDISGLKEGDKMLEVITENNLPYILMHMQGSPANMQDNPTYQNIMIDLLSFFKEKHFRLRNAGVKDIIIDPGFGFGKTQDHNFEILQKLASFEILNCPILIGLSRKSMIHKTLNIEASQALNGSTALHMAALLNGAKILRVHDVLEAKECIILHKALVDRSVSIN